jgi:hypothetical protein
MTLWQATRYMVFLMGKYLLIRVTLNLTKSLSHNTSINGADTVVQ